MTDDAYAKDIEERLASLGLTKAQLQQQWGNVASVRARLREMEFYFRDEGTWMYVPAYVRDDWRHVWYGPQDSSDSVTKPPRFYFQYSMYLQVSSPYTLVDAPHSIVACAAPLLLTLLAQLTDSIQSLGPLAAKLNRQ